MDAAKPQQRRLTAILSADVAGYSRLMHQDDEATLAALNQARATFAAHIEQRGGRVVDTAGDSVLAEFPSVVDATRCAVEVQQAIAEGASDLPEARRMRFRIGISLGDVLVEGEAIYGDGVNIAARVQTLATPGGICISGVAYNQVKDKLKLAYQFTGKQQVKNISDPVPVYRIGTDTDVRHHSIPTAPLLTPARIAWLASVAITLVVGFGLWMLWAPLSDTTASRHGDNQASSAHTPSLVVLPFTNLSKDPEQEYFSDGITEDLITSLSRLSRLTVIARTSAFTYKDKNSTIADVARDLDVRYVIEGSVQKVANQVRITAKLVDSHTAHPLWAQRYDRELKDLFVMQDEVTQHIVNALAVQLTTFERDQLGQSPTNSLAAYDWFLRGQRYFQQKNQEGSELAREAYRQAIELDPSYARAYGALAVLAIYDYRNGWTDAPEQAKSRALELAKKAVALDATSPQVYWSLGFVSLFHKRYAEAAAAVQRAVTLAPNYADGYGLLAFISNFQGRAEDAVIYIRKAMALNPYYTYDYPWNLGRAYYTLGRYAEAAEALEDANYRNQNALYPRLYLAATYVRLGRHADAAWQVDEIVTQNPSATLSHLSNTFPIENPTQLGEFLEDLREAGLPE